MMPTLKAELRKLYTVRATYVTTLIALGFMTFYAFYVEGFRAGGSVVNSGKLAGEVTGALSALSVFGALVGVLLMTHEYRYNTITYTLTASKSRSRVLLAKIIIISGFAVLFSLLIGGLSPVMSILGMHLKGLTLVHQTIPVGDLLWRGLFAGWGFAMMGLLLAALIRNQVGAIVALFLIPSTIEPLAGLLLKKNAAYLPFTALGAVLEKANISHTDAALVVLAYLIIGWLVAWLLFLRRDAN